MNDSTLVYSTETGRMCPECGRPQKKCTCKKRKPRNFTKEAGDGIIRIKREVKGRKGKTVTTISGFQETGAELKKIASQLKNRCGTGGSVKDGVIMIQGDHRETLKAELTKQGFQVKLAGG
ncbi:MAG: translation initiation factor Sui1 [Desulfobacterales bacterium]|jgi:translation initiation factor 1